AVQFDDGVSRFRRAEAEANVLEARPKADAAPLDAVRRLRRLLAPPALTFLTPARMPRAFFDHFGHGDTRRERCAYMRRDALAQHVLQPQLDGVHTQLRGQLVYLVLCGERTLRAAEAPERAG